MFCIYNERQNKYICDKDLVISFPTVEEAYGFLNSFFQFAVAMVSKDPFLTMEIMQEMPFFKIEELNTSTMKNIIYTECTNEKRRKGE